MKQQLSGSMVNISFLESLEMIMRVRKKWKKGKKEQQNLQSYAWQLYLIAILNTKMLASKKVFEERSGWAGTWRTAMDAVQQSEQDKF